MVLDDFSLTIPAGKVTALCGLSGAGQLGSSGSPPCVGEGGGGCGLVGSPDCVDRRWGLLLSLLAMCGNVYEECE